MRCCVRGYPAPAEDYNLRTIPDMIQYFGLVTGLSDRTLDNATAIASVAIGESIIEKHFSLDRKGGGPDDSFSLEPSDLLELCRNTKLAWQALGQVEYGHKPSEQANLKLHRSLYFLQALKAGDVITADAVRRARPGLGLPPKYLTEIIGQRVTRDVNENSPVTLEALR